jgi:hypothetical protein
MITTGLKTKLWAFAGLVLMAGAFSTGASANLVQMPGYGGGIGMLGCGDTSPSPVQCQGFVNVIAAPPEIDFSSTTADAFDTLTGNSNGTSERDTLNNLLGRFDPALLEVDFFEKHDGEGWRFTTSLPYFSIKKGNPNSGGGWWFFQNSNYDPTDAIASALLVALNPDVDDGYSHWTEYDFRDTGVVPVPAAIWLFGTALIGFAGFSRKNKQV